MGKTMKKILCSVLVVLMCLTSAPLGGFVGLEWPEWNFNAFALEAEEPMYTYNEYTYTVSDGEATIVKVSSKIKGSVTIPSELGEYPVTVIGYEAFSDCDHITTLEIPSSVKKIGERAFYSCNNLTEVTIPDSVTEMGSYAFNSCTSLVSVTVPSSVTVLQTGVFEKCSNLISVNLPETLVSIDEYAFRYCSSLAVADIPESVVSIGEYAFFNCDSLTELNISSGVVSIGSYAFSWCYSLTNVLIPSGVETIGAGAFYDCNNLVSVYISEGVSSIGDSAFGDCNKLNSISVDENNTAYTDIDGVLFNKDKTELIQYPIGNEKTEYSVNEEVKRISSGAFYGADNIINITFLGKTLEYIGRKAFMGCNNLKTINLPEGITEVCDYTFYDCSSLESINIPDGVLTIGDEALSMSGLKSINIPGSVKEIGRGAFSYCRELSEVVFNEGLEFIGENAFSGCASLEAVTIPDTVIMIERYAFSAQGLKEISVDSNNEFYSNDISGTLYNKDKTVLVQYPIGNERDEFKVPDSVLRIKEGAFANSCDLKVVTIPDGTVNIGESAFYSCGSLYDITIPKSVSSVGYGAFDRCSNLSDVYYWGNENEWEKIIISNENDELLNARIHYNYDENHIISISEIMAPTCGQWGKSTYSCKCGLTYEKDIPPVGEHVWGEWTVDNMPTCKGEGHEIRTCEVCGSNEYKEIPALGGEHIWGEWITESEPCVVPGRKYRLCDICSYREDDDIPATGKHVWDEWDIWDEPTCTSDGYKERNCKNCDEYEGESIPNLGGHDWGEWEIINETSSCTEPDYAIRYCKNCSDEESKYVEGSEGEHIWGEWDIGREPTCTEDGYKERMCTVCYDWEEDLIPALGGEHVWSEWEIWGNCTEDGYKITTCTVCGDDEYEDIPALGGEHVWSEWEIWDNCTEDGYKIRTCTVCGDSEYEDIPALGGEHIMGGWETLTDATCIGWGERINKCTVCSFEDYDYIEPKGHSFGEWKWDEVHMYCYRVCHCGYMQGNKFEIDGNDDTEIYYPEDPDAEFDVDIVGKDDSRYILVEEAFNEFYSGEYDILKVFDINLKNNAGVHVQPDGTVKVKLPLDWEKEGNYKVYRVNDDKTLTDMDAFRQGSHMVFDTDHFSIYVIVDLTQSGGEDLPDEPDTPVIPENPSENCDCRCHKSGIAKFFFNIGLFFQKLFKKNAVCACGVAHY
ncbi:MAG: leucine-rich repeat domain-containing protein [Clostridia bacterium]|nr:leucine-rich repeat domain-containing protein [Clostridia bacterium]